MNQKKHKTEDLGNWKPFVEQLHKEWEKVKSEQVDENLELKEKTWKRVDRKYSLLVVIFCGQDGRLLQH